MQIRHFDTTQAKHPLGFTLATRTSTPFASFPAWGGFPQVQMVLASSWFAANPLLLTLKIPAFTRFLTTFGCLHLHPPRPFHFRFHPFNYQPKQSSIPTSIAANFTPGSPFSLPSPLHQSPRKKPCLRLPRASIPWSEYNARITVSVPTKQYPGLKQTHKCPKTNINLA